MSAAPEIVITGLGVVSPLGIGKEPFVSALEQGLSGVRTLPDAHAQNGPLFGAEVRDFNPKEFVKPRKSLKVMSRDIQLGVTAAELAFTDAGLDSQSLDPERIGVDFGADMIHCMPEDVASAYRQCIVDGKFDPTRWGESAMAEIYPLWMLKYLPNMPACHIAIARDARGPNNSHSLAECSSLTAIAEAARVIQRGHADIMIAGGTGSRMSPVVWVRNSLLPVSRRVDRPEAASRPFDRDRDGFVNGEGAAAFILESRRHAEARRARILGQIIGFSGAFETPGEGGRVSGAGTRRAIVGALQMAGLASGEIGHVNANGLSTPADDRAEAQAIRAELGDTPVTAPKSYFGTLGSGAGAVELAVSLLAFETGKVPATLNYDSPDPECPVNVVAGQPLTGAPPTAVLLNQSSMGQSVALVARGG